ncbi:UPF0691 protein C9orf116 homolog [Tachysurus fulvidraco]|uniref:UPF0691 protein C9orf116 homolog n=1 Tax=Tachysurus fulvidraco TaxID=1234273 RepID=UPI000F4F5724|nr:UPF0691 protein C9orf116 homolog [Tachysurus fulvidraco]
MDAECLDAGINMEQNQPDQNINLKTNDVYRVNENLPKRFNNPDCFKGYSKKRVHLLYQTTSQTYGSRKPTVHEMPTSFHGRQNRFSDHIMKSGMSRDSGINTWLEKSRITGPNAINIMQDRIIFHRLCQTAVNDQTDTNKI